MNHIGWIVTFAFIVDMVIRTGLSIRVIMRRIPIGSALAWVVVILVFPFIGAALYVLLGEYRLGPRRTRRVIAVRAQAERFLADRLTPAAADPSRLESGGSDLARLGESLFHAPLLVGNHLELLPGAEASFSALISAIDRATRSCDLEFYIWSPGGRADEVAQAVGRAAGRGVTCRVLVDALGSEAFLRSASVEDMRRRGVRVQAAIRVHPMSALFTRPDLRLHRKIVVIDGRVAFTGSLNIADPRFFKRDAGVGQWVDAMARVEGPAVTALHHVLLQDWVVETGEDLKTLAGPAESAPLPGGAPVQILASGPMTIQAIEHVLLTAIYQAQRELIITTPYFIPSDPLLMALSATAARGVRVTLIVPAEVDSRLAHYASRAHQADLLDAGVRVALFDAGLLHTKSVTIDAKHCLFGSINLDPRSLRLDFEVTMVVHDEAFTSVLRDLQHRYLERSEMLDAATCRSRSAMKRFAENAARLAGPVL